MKAIQIFTSQQSFPPTQNNSNDFQSFCISPVIIFSVLVTIFNFFCVLLARFLQRTLNIPKY